MESIFNLSFPECHKEYLISKDKIEKDNLEYFKNRPPVYSGDPYELLDRLFTFDEKGFVTWQYECREDIKRQIEAIARKRAICIGEFY
jgi:hypothetical protein